MNHKATGIQYWRSLEHLAESDEVRKLIESEFPGYDPQEMLSPSRRSFLKLMGASLALAGLTLSGCRRAPQEKLAPYSSNPKDRIPGIPEQYATVMELDGIGHGLLVTSFDGRPIKIEGNPTHPFSRTSETLGAADAFAQASVLELYDPDRSRSVVRRVGTDRRLSTWDQFQEFADSHFEHLRNSKGAGFAVLCEATSSPSVLAMKQRLLETYSQCHWYEYEPLTRDNELAGLSLVTGRPMRTRLHLEKASTVVLFDADLLGSHPAHVRYAADWATQRRSADQGSMSRVYLAESCYSTTGAVADVRLPVRPSRMEQLILVLATKLAVNGAQSHGDLSPEEMKFIESAVADLKSHPGSALVAAGSYLPPQLHAWVHAINTAIGAIGHTVTLVEDPAGNRPMHAQAIAELTRQLQAGQVKTLLILGGNPVYDAPVDLEFPKALANVPVSIHLSLYDNETSLQCTWHLPRAHHLETWGDARAWDGTLSVAQPLIEPIYGGKSIIEVLAILANDPILDGEQIVRRTMAQWLPKDDFEKAYRRVLHDGVLVVGNENTPVKPTDINPPAFTLANNASAGLELRFLPSRSTYDGRFANSGWLQELPDPITKLTWDNAAIISKKDADHLGITTGDVLRITVGARSIEIVAYVLPGQPVGVIGLSLGYGRRAAGNVGNGVGVDTYALRTTDALYLAAGAQVQPTGRRYTLAMTQDHHIIDRIGQEGRDARIGSKGQSGPLIHEAQLADYKADEHLFHRNEHGGLSLKLFEPPHKFNDPHAWGMAVDMNSCIGCNACVVACQAENNIPVVGKEQVIKNREMHWIRIDRYFKGAADDPNPEVVYQPVMCQHCENAPCEQVCPVGATMHDTEGLNAMVYNRCIGTRYCSNNCPYKVRRFNYLDF
ncbi:MAG: TAT-variant-translocated molybdopterin oxidoreductase, partial [Bacillota bacterium]